MNEKTGKKKKKKKKKEGWKKSASNLIKMQKLFLLSCYWGLRVTRRHLGSTFPCFYFWQR
jgi:hypothetical protein